MSMRIDIWLVALLLLPLGCTVDPLVAAGRPCSSTEPCPEGTYCHPGVLVCIRGSAATDAGRDGPDDDAQLPMDSWKMDARVDQSFDLSLDQPTAADSQVDLGSACTGLSCQLGCNVAAKRCYRLMPSTFNPSSFHANLSKDLKLNKDTEFDTDTGKVTQGSSILRPAGSTGAEVNGIYWSVVNQAPGYPSIAVFATASLYLPQGNQIAVVGKRAFAYYASKSITISGTLTMPAVGAAAGPGGFSGGPKNGSAGQSCFGGQGLGGAHGGSGSDQVESGGGGGGRKAVGGVGASSNITPFPAGGASGAAVGSVKLVPLFGGCGGGAGGGPDTGSGSPGDGGAGGGGGGAIQLVSNGVISISGQVSVPGAGGGGGHSGAGGGGGGSGGVILIEGISVMLSGFLAANGGGGGSGSAAVQQAHAPDGADGTSSSSAAVGGATNPPHGGAGGSGGARSKEAGGKGAIQANGGGGGGAAGRIRINSPGAVSSTKNTSPTASISSSVATW